MTILTQNGAGHRTERLTRERADRFAKCLQANPRFDGVTVVENPNAKGERRFYVTWIPASNARQQDLRELHAAIQIGRGECQWMNYVVTATETAGRYDVENQQNGETYQVQLHAAVGNTCTCPQWEARCRPAGIDCKHCEVVRIHLRLDLVQPSPAVIGAPDVSDLLESEPLPAPARVSRIPASQWAADWGDQA